MARTAFLLALGLSTLAARRPLPAPREILALLPGGAGPVEEGA